MLIDSTPGIVFSYRFIVNVFTCSKYIIELTGGSVYGPSPSAHQKIFWKFSEIVGNLWKKFRNSFENQREIFDNFENIKKSKKKDVFLDLLQFTPQME